MLVSKNFNLIQERRIWQCGAPFLFAETSSIVGMARDLWRCFRSHLGCYYSRRKWTTKAQSIRYSIPVWQGYQTTFSVWDSANIKSLIWSFSSQRKLETRIRELRKLGADEQVDSQTYWNLPFNQIIKKQSVFVGCHKLYGTISLSDIQAKRKWFWNWIWMLNGYFSHTKQHTLTPYRLCEMNKADIPEQRVQTIEVTVAIKRPKVSPYCDASTLQPSFQHVRQAYQHINNLLLLLWTSRTSPTISTFHDLETSSIVEVKVERTTERREEKWFWSLSAYSCYTFVQSLMAPMSV